MKHQLTFFTFLDRPYMYILVPRTVPKVCVVAERSNAVHLFYILLRCVFTEQQRAAV